MAVQSLKPRLDLIKARYGDDKDRIQKETNVLYEEAGVNPLAGCLPSIATIPIFIGLYRSLSNVASEGLLDTQGFFWIPSLAGPTTVVERGSEWLYPFVDGHPPIGWHDALAYLVLPVLVVLAQIASTAIIAPPINPKDDNANTQKAMLVLLPLMVGYFSVNLPSGLGLYYFANTVFTSMIQIWLKKLGGANVQINELGPVTKLGSGRRLGPVVQDSDWWTPPPELAAAFSEDGGAAAAATAGDGDQGGAPVAAAGPAAAATVEASELQDSEQIAASVAAKAQAVTGMLPPVINRKCKRKKVEAATAAG